MEVALVQGCALTGAKSILSSNGCQNLTSLNDRISEFIVDRFPDQGSPVELLCVDHIGTYVVPYPCRQAHKLTLDGLVERALELSQKPLRNSLFAIMFEWP